MANLRTVLKYLIPLLLAISLTWYMLKDINPEILIQRISSADLKWIMLAVVISLFAHLSRAYRWNILLRPLGYYPSLKNTFMAIMVGYFGNIVLPRGGEVMRCMVLTRTDQIPFNASFGTVVAERAFDFICLLLLIGLSFLLEFQRFYNFFQQYFLHKEITGQVESRHNILWLVLILLSLIAAIILFLTRGRIVNSLIFTKGKDFLKGLIKGILSIKDIKEKGAFLLHTFFIWFGYFLMTYLMFFSFKPTSGLGPLAGLVVLIVGGLGMSAPVTGGIGVFHKMVASALLLFYGLNENDGLAYAFVIHTSQMITVLIVGGLCSLYILTLRKKVRINDVPVS
jgi:uncharacterized protein (TIRG00374 family)